MDDFMQAIQRGYFDVVNPFNRKKTRVPSTPDKVHSIVFWSKDFTHLIRGKFIQGLRELGYHLFFNYTINSQDLLLEPCLPSLEHRLVQLENLTQLVGPDTIFWRFDPICYYRLGDGKIFHNRHDFLKIADAVSELGIRTCITSFMDIYPKVQKRSARFPGFSFIDPPLETKVTILQEMAGNLKRRNITLFTCCEKSLHACLPTDSGIEQSSCIPNKYLAKLFGSNLSFRKDAGQRTQLGCGCGTSVDIGSYRHQPCYHNCMFCYANPGETAKKPDNEHQLDSN